MLVKTPSILKKILPKYVWDISTHKKVIYLTFDDGPTPEITTKVLAILSQFNAKATFFCIGENISKYADIFNQIIEQDHAVGNHTYNHLKGWKSNANQYVDNVLKTDKILSSKPKVQNSKLFRPPYGQIKPSQGKALRKLGYHIIMWDVLSYDWEHSLKKEQILKNVIDNTVSGSIVVFHDSIKASKHMLYALPKVLDFFSKKGYFFEKLS